MRESRIVGGEFGPALRRPHHDPGQLDTRRGVDEGRMEPATAGTVTDETDAEGGTRDDV